MVFFDGVILAHCNESEWNRFKSEHTNEAILDRVVKINVPYCLELDQEVKIYKKILSRADFKAHIAPHNESAVLISYIKDQGQRHPFGRNVKLRLLDIDCLLYTSPSPRDS